MTVLDHEGFWSKLQTSRLRSIAKAGFPEARAGFRILLAAITLALVSSSLFLISVSGQQSSQSVEIDPQELQEKPYVARFTQRPGEISLQINGDDVNYQWVRYQWVSVKAPEVLTIKAIGELDGYKREELLQANVWYQFKKRLPLTVMVGQGDEEKYDLKLEFGRLKPGAIPPNNGDEARAYGAGEADSVKRRKGSPRIHIVDDTLPILEVEPTSLTMERPRDANSRPSQETLRLSAIDSASSKPTWAFVKFKNRDIDVAVDKGTDKEKSTAAPGEQLDSGRFFGFTGSLKLVLTRRGFVNDDPITLVLQGGRGEGEPGTREAAIDAIKKPDDQKIAVRGPELRVQIATVKPIPPPGATNYWMIIIISAAGLVVLVVALFFILKKRPKAMATGGGPSASDLLGGLQDAPSTGAGGVYDSLNDGYQAKRNTETFNHPQPNWLERLFPFFGRSKGGGESEEEREARLLQQREYAKREARGQLSKDAAKMDVPTTAPLKVPVSGATDTAVRDVHAEAQKPKEVEPISQELLKRAVAEYAEASVKQGLGPVEERVQAIENLLYGLQGSFNDHRDTLRGELDAHRAAVAEQWRTTRAELEKKLDAKLNRSSDDIRLAREEFDKRLNDIESDSQVSQAEQDKRDGFYAALLSSILERSVDGLQGDRLSSTVLEAADALNKFFQTQIPRSEVLDELAVRAERIRSSLKAVVDRAAAFNSQAEIEIAEPLQRATNLVAELSVMQAQLRSRQVALDARVGLPVPVLAEQSGATPYDPKLQVPVSAHSKARYTFIEELGFAIKREMDKFRDPPGYFKREIEKLVTSDVISVADICDSKTKNNELEQSLQVLFSEAGLRSILPKPKEQFDPTEQTIIQIVSGGGPADSQRIVKVVSRGFYYNDGEKDRLLRKAGVEVYR